MRFGESTQMLQLDRVLVWDGLLDGTNALLA